MASSDGKYGLHRGRLGATQGARAHAYLQVRAVLLTALDDAHAQLEVRALGAASKLWGGGEVPAGLHAALWGAALAAWRRRVEVGCDEATLRALAEVRPRADKDIRLRGCMRTCRT